MKEVVRKQNPPLLLLDEDTRACLWKHTVAAVEDYTKDVNSLPVSQDIKPRDIRGRLELFDFEKSLEPLETLKRTLDLFSNYTTHASNSGYFGLYDPATSTMGLIAELLVATFNPQLSVWTQSPIAVEIEQFLVQKFGEKFGFNNEDIDGTFTTGGAEANHTAILNALTYRFPKFAHEGLRALEKQPVLYVSAEAHHSVSKAARLCGLGDQSVRTIQTDAKLKMDAEALSKQIVLDKASGFSPFLIVNTAGTTNAGIIDPIAPLVEIAARENIWLHIDAAWGGAVVLVPEMRYLLEGIDKADSITFDPHKWLSVPRGAGLYLTRRKSILNQTFKVSASYMPLLQNTESEVVDGFNHSIQWSRRFIGLKLFMTLAVAGWDGYAESIREQVRIAEYMRRELEKSDWAVINDSSLAVLCFIDPTRSDGLTKEYLDAVRKMVLDSGKSWISTTVLANGQSALRACVVNYKSNETDVNMLVNALNAARKSIKKVS